MSGWTRTEKLALYSLMVAIIAVIVALFLPELRRRIGLNSEPGLAFQTPSNNSLIPNAPVDGSPNTSSKKTPEKKVETKTITISAQSMWTDTNVRVRAGDVLNISASGQVSSNPNPDDAASKWVGPDGWGYDPAPQWTISGKPARWIWVLGRGSSFMCLTGKIGKNGKPFAIGSSYMFTSSESGTLFLGVNDLISDSDGNIKYSLDESGVIWLDNSGAFTARLRKE